MPETPARTESGRTRRLGGILLRRSHLSVIQKHAGVKVESLATVVVIMQERVEIKVVQNIV